jgi:hypothetical protein
MSHYLVCQRRAVFMNMVAIIICFLFMSSCARKMTFGVSSVVPAAKGSVKVKTDKNKNYAIDMRITNLAEPGRLTPPRRTYVVWMETSEGIKNIGQLRTSSGLLSKAMRAHLKTVTTFKPESFFITAEDDASVTMPGSTVVLRTN